MHHEWIGVRQREGQGKEEEEEKIFKKKYQRKKPNIYLF